MLKRIQLFIRLLKCLEFHWQALEVDWLVSRADQVACCIVFRIDGVENGARHIQRHLIMLDRNSGAKDRISSMRADEFSSVPQSLVQLANVHGFAPSEALKWAFEEDRVEGGSRQLLQLKLCLCDQGLEGFSPRSR